MGHFTCILGDLLSEKQHTQAVGAAMAGNGAACHRFDHFHKGHHVEQVQGIERHDLVLQEVIKT